MLFAARRADCYEQTGATTETASAKMEIETPETPMKPRKEGRNTR
jgi:hypothetical protein